MPICDRCQADLNYPQELPPEVDPNLQIIKIPAREVHITFTELSLLRLLWHHRGQQITSERMINYLWGSMSPEDGSRTIRVHISRLRRKLTGLPYAIGNYYGSYSFRLLDRGC